LSTTTDPVIPDRLANSERRECFARGFRLFYKFEQEGNVMTGDEVFVCCVQLHPHTVTALAVMSAHSAEHIQCEQRFVAVQDAGEAFTDAVRAGLELIEQVA